MMFGMLLRRFGGKAAKHIWSKHGQGVALQHAFIFEKMGALGVGLVVAQQTDKHKMACCMNAGDGIGAVEQETPILLKILRFPMPAG